MHRTLRTKITALLAAGLLVGGGLALGGSTPEAGNKPVKNCVLPWTKTMAQHPYACFKRGGKSGSW